MKTHPSGGAQERAEQAQEEEEAMEWEQVDTLTPTPTTADTPNRTQEPRDVSLSSPEHILSPTHTHSPNTTIRLAVNRLGPHEDADAMNEAVKCLWNVVRLFPHDRELFVEMQAIQATIEHIRDHRISAVSGVAQAQSDDHTAYIKDAQELMDAWLAQRLQFHQRRLVQMAMNKRSQQQ